MADAAKRRATYDDVLAAPAHVVAEVIYGALYTHPRPAIRHARASTRLGGKLVPFDDDDGKPGGWIILDEPELHLGNEPDILVPDLAGWRRTRMPEMPDTAFVTLAPDWICEVVSPSTEAIDRSDKMDIYAREGIAHAWLVDPITKLLEVYRLAEKQWLRVGTWRDDARMRAEPFDAIEIE
ncbi:MAG: Uma2 family endonuclease, partial [Polyangiaceae bacterium]